VAQDHDAVGAWRSSCSAHSAAFLFGRDGSGKK
jgi:hypothetical protein